MYAREMLRQWSAWRHKQTEGVYVVVGVGKCSTNGPRDMVEESVFYYGCKSKMFFYREVGEFLDGRFVPLHWDGSTNHTS